MSEVCNNCGVKEVKIEIKGLSYIRTWEYMCDACWELSLDTVTGTPTSLTLGSSCIQELP